MAHLQVLYRYLLNERLQDPAISAAKLAHLFVAKYNTAIVVQSCLEGEAAPVLPALEVDVVPLNDEDCPWGGEQRAGWPGRWGREEGPTALGAKAGVAGNWTLKRQSRESKRQLRPLMFVTSTKSQALFCCYLIRSC